MPSSEPITINVQSVLEDRLGKRGQRIPRFIVRGIERLIHQEDMNDILRNAFPSRGPEFCRKALEQLDVHLDIRDEANMPQECRCLFVCNHPLGGLDGIAIIEWLSRHYGHPVHFVVNDLLSAVEPLSECFVPVNKHGTQSRQAIAALDEAFAGPDPVVMFPAGLVSRRGKGGAIADLKWHKMFVNKAIEHGRDIVPMYFDGRNTSLFYNMARIRKKLGIRFNIEMVLLPREVFRSRGARFTLFCGKPIPCGTLKGRADADTTAGEIRDIVYSLPLRNQSRL